MSWKPDERHEGVVQVALAWQQTADSAEWWEMGATRGAHESAVYALVGQIAAAGEQLGLAYGASGEVGLWRRVRAREANDPAHELCMRAMAEAQTLFVTGTGHALANVAARALTLRPGPRARLAQRLDLHEAFLRDPFSNRRADFLSLNGKTCRAIRDVAGEADHEAVAELVAPVVELGLGPAWRELQERRGEDFHRWRPQSHGVQGVPRSSPWEHDGTTRSIGERRRPYTDAHGLADEAADLAQRAMLDLAAAMQVFQDRWPLASVHLGGPDFVVEPRGSGHHGVR